MRGTKLLLTVLITGSLLAPVLASDFTIPSIPLYTFQNSIMLQDEFISGDAASGGIGQLGFTFSGGTVTPIATAGSSRFGLIRRDTGTTSGTQASTRLCPGTGSCFDPALPHLLIWVTRLNTNDANTTVRLGSSTAIVSPPTNGIYFEKLDADTNWFCVTRAAGVETRVDSGVAVNTAFNTFRYTRTSSGAQFTLNNVNVCGLIATNLPSTIITVEASIINSAAASKTLDFDYFEFILTGLVR